MPENTLNAFRDHGDVRDRLFEGITEARETIAAVERAGISLEKVTADLTVDGVRQFSDAFDKLLGSDPPDDARR